MPLKVIRDTFIQYLTEADKRKWVVNPLNLRFILFAYNNSSTNNKKHLNIKPIFKDL